MQSYTIFPDTSITAAGPIAERFRHLGVTSFQAACRWVHALPYGYNSNRDDMLTLFREGLGSCTTKHAVIATLAGELNLPIGKVIGIYAMTETLVTGTQAILDSHKLPYLPMIHCFLDGHGHQVDLTMGKRNGKNGPIEEFLATFPARAAISAKEEYLLYREALQDTILVRAEWAGIKITQVLKAREAGLTLLHDLIG